MYSPFSSFSGISIERHRFLQPEPRLPPPADSTDSADSRCACRRSAHGSEAPGESRCPSLTIAGKTRGWPSTHSLISPASARTAEALHDAEFEALEGAPQARARFLPSPYPSALAFSPSGVVPAHLGNTGRAGRGCRPDRPRSPCTAASCRAARCVRSGGRRCPKPARPSAAAAAPAAGRDRPRSARRAPAPDRR